MVKICTSYYTNEEKYKQYFEKYSYTPHSFQKWSIEGILLGNDILVTAPTGSGKTLCGEFPIEYFHSQGKKSIYCSPIKSLSNQKFYDFKNKYPDITFGILTGDIKCNPDADCLIMTTEILLNKLYQLKTKEPISASSISFDMDIENELGCVVFDEIHYINDPSRGHVWEQSIIMLPEHVQIIGLSATLDNPEKFAHWIENRIPNKKLPEKTVYLTSRKDRAVPLIHYSFITTNSGIFKAIKDKSIQEEIKSLTNKPFVIQNAKGEFNETHYHKMHKMLQLFETKNTYIKRSHVLNQTAKYLVENEMLPAICYVFSKKQLEICAKEMNTVLLEDDSKVRYIVERECEQIIRKLPNYKEYLELPEYLMMISLLEKGVAIHHAGILPPLREIVELLFAKGYIKLLFATETMAIGLNLPVKTTIFTGLEKFDGDHLRMLYAHEYTQSAGRAGRLGLDTVGHVIHLNNLFKNVELVNYKNMMSGRPQTLVSKFKISYHLLLNLIRVEEYNFVTFTKRSMIQGDIDNELSEYYSKISTLTCELDKISQLFEHNKIPLEIIQTYIELSSKKNKLVNKQRKECDKQLQSILQSYPNIEKETPKVVQYNTKCKELSTIQEQFVKTENVIFENIQKVVDILKTTQFIEDGDTHKYKLTTKGHIASQLREVHCLVFAELIMNKTLDKFLAKELVSIFSCFTNIGVSEEYMSINPYSENKQIQSLLVEIQDKYNKHKDKETHQQLNTGVDYDIQFDIIDYVLEWCEATNDSDCKLVLQKMESEKTIFLGDFVKAILKINNISSELEKIAEYIGNIELLHKLREIPQLTLKYVATNQSLYIHQ